MVVGTRALPTFMRLPSEGTVEPSATNKQVAKMGFSPFDYSIVPIHTTSLMERETGKGLFLTRIVPTTLSEKQPSRQYKA